MSLVLKRGRGRPRLNESREFNDSDLQLVNEFKKRPALYDRNDQMYRDKENSDRLWQELAEVLNTPVPQIKDRTTQLRNRYNIERRRLDNIIEQGGDESAVKSPWLLYEHLTFLSDHIKSRRSLLPSRPESPIPRTSKRIKLQTNLTTTTTTSSDDEDLESNEPIRNAAALPPFPFASPAYNSYHNYYLQGEENGFSNGITNIHTKSDDHNSIPLAENSAKSKVYQSFGNFVSSSLISMKEKDALRLLEKFTKELVHTMNSPAAGNHDV